jgi:hypothetical protein
VDDRTRVLEVAEVVDEVVRVDIIRELERRKILPLLSIVAAIDDQYVVIGRADSAARRSHFR